VSAPQPVDGVQLCPASSENDIALHSISNCVSKVRPVRWSVNVIASSVFFDVGAVASAWVTLLSAPNTMRVSCPAAPNITASRIGS
jgi:hypothetical protein